MASVERELAALLATPLVATVERVHQSTPPPPNPIRIEPPSLRAPAQGEPLRGEWRRSEPQTANADDLRRQADHFIDLLTLKDEVGRDLAERPQRRAEPDEEDNDEL